MKFLIYIDPYAIDKSTPLTYNTDDIRLCTMQKIIPEVVLGIFPFYHRHEGFHYVKLSDDYQSTLAFHAGIKSFDRVIECNGINIENDSAENFRKIIDNTRNQLLQLLVCNPSTYTHYKKNNKRIHSSLETVKFQRPVQDTTGMQKNDSSFLRKYIHINRYIKYDS
jgi:C-terminal processing protease CtpA/Prc